MVYFSSMTYTFKGFKTIHFDENGFNPDGIFNSDKLTLAGQIANPVGNAMPIILEWRYKIFENDAQPVSYVVAAYYIITFEKGEYPYLTLVHMIQECYQSFIKRCKRDVFGIEPDDAPEKLFDKTIVGTKAEEIIGYARKLKLL